ncbi:hypothetical protein [Methylomicrobium sp. Wu6]|uniref:hypothetical protein n=1 Tax=Methylomicrobium sp. Wu6 TaxID=3107928 RepID=UPI002DD62BF8|nr:hypothetical protein [Methylomicrobium sp. Wu6]
MKFYTLLASVSASLIILISSAQAQSTDSQLIPPPRDTDMYTSPELQGKDLSDRIKAPSRGRIKQSPQAYRAPQTSGNGSAISQTEKRPSPDKSCISQVVEYAPPPWIISSCGAEVSVEVLIYQNGKLFDRQYYALGHGGRARLRWGSCGVLDGCTVKWEVDRVSWIK